MYITGDLSMNGNSTITLNADPAAPKPCVLFVHGSITVNGGSKLVNNGVLIVSDGIQTFNGNSNVYSVSDMVNCGLMCFNTDPNLSIKINGGAGVANVGVAYAINGGVTLSGGSVFQGSITAGGTPSTVSMSGGSSVRYEAGWNASFAPGAPSYTSSGLSNWVTTR